MESFSLVPGTPVQQLIFPRGKADPLTKQTLRLKEIERKGDRERKKRAREMESKTGKMERKRKRERDGVRDKRTRLRDEEWDGASAGV